MLFNEYIFELKAVEEEKQRESKTRKEEQVCKLEFPTFPFSWNLMSSSVKVVC